jgi:hypothetical protein
MVQLTQCLDSAEQEKVISGIIYKYLFICQYTQRLSK